MSALSEFKISKAKKREKPYKLSDGGGLFLLVKPNGSKLWQQKYRFADKERLLSHGPYQTYRWRRRAANGTRRAS